MRFANPIFLVLAALAPVFALWCAYMTARREKAMAKLSSSPPSSSAQWIQIPLVSLGLALAAFAAARPQWGRSNERLSAASRNVVVAIDVSRSMLARDVRPDRLGRAKADVADLIDSLEGDRCSLVAFRRTGVALCPLTTDKGFLRSALESLSPESAPRGETDLGSAIRESLRVIAQVEDAAEKAGRSAIILISDGGDLRGGALEAARIARKRGIPVFTVGIGDPSRGATIPSEDGGVQKFNGSPVTVKLEEAALKSIAAESGGRYVPLATAGMVETTLGSIYGGFLRKVAADEQNEADDRLSERYAWFLVPGTILLAAGMSLSRGRLRRAVPGGKS